MRLLSLTLDGTYKGLKDQTFDFQNTKGNILALIGLNGSGKSQLLELIAESFAFLERKQRKDFTVRRALGFGFTLIYQLSGTTNHSAGSHGMSCGNPLAITGGISNPIFKVVLSDGHIDPLVYIHLNGDWTEIHINSLELPYIIGYSSGLNENLQRSFMKNAVQYFDLMTPRIRRRKAVSKAKSEAEIAEINQQYLQRYPKIFTFGVSACVRLPSRPHCAHAVRPAADTTFVLVHSPMELRKGPVVAPACCKADEKK